MHFRLSGLAIAALALLAILHSASGWPGQRAAGDEITGAGRDKTDSQLPRVVFETDFSKDFTYILPHRFDTSSKAKTVADGILTVRVVPGMYGASSDEPERERAEYAQAVPPGAMARQSFLIRIPAGFTAPKRTLVAQFKPPVGGASPPLSLYLSEGGEVKYVDYLGTDDAQRHDQHHTRLAPLGINLLDGQWHDVTMTYWRSDTAGYVQATIDGRTVVEKKGYDSNPGGEATLNARIGIYRDALPIEQSVQYDDWKVEAAPPPQ